MVKEVFNAVKNWSPWEKGQLISRITIELSRKGVIASRKEALKVALKAIQVNWKDQLLEAHYKDPLSLHFPSFKYDNALTAPITRKDRWQEILGEPFSIIYGSTFSTNRKELHLKEGHHLLDAAFAAVCLDKKGAFAGYAFSVADGAGGHFGDATQDENIANGAKAGCKSCVRLFSAYTDPDALFKELEKVVEAIGNEIKRKGKGESCTLLGCRAFPVEKGFRLIGFNVGDGLLAAYDPVENALKTLISAHVTEKGTALLPGNYKPFELYLIDLLLPENSLLFLMTDGVHDMLLHKEEEAVYSNGLKYRTRSLNPIDGKIRCESLVQICFDEAERKRRATHLPNQQIGDDCTLLQGILKKEK